MPDLRPLLAGLLPAVLVACSAPSGPEDALGPGEDLAPPPTYAELAARHNERVEDIARYWASATISVRWRDPESGNRKTEQAEGYVMFEPPDRTAVVLSKAGETIMWIGSSDERFWMFERGDPSLMRVARTVNAFHPAADPLPIGFHPLEIIDLFGFAPLPTPPEDAPAAAAGPRVRLALDGTWAVDTPGRWSVRRTFFDPDSALPVRVELRDPLGGELLAWSDLSEYEPMDIPNRAEYLSPAVPSLVLLHSGEPETTEDEYVKVGLRGRARDRKPRGRWGSDQFEFEGVRRYLRPDRIIVLDARTADPALPPTTTKDVAAEDR